MVRIRCQLSENYCMSPLIKRADDEMASGQGDDEARREGPYLLRSPANARRLLRAYGNALSGAGVSERELIDPEVTDTG